MQVKAKIVAYNYKESDSDGCSDFSLNMYWGGDYKNVFYLCGDLGRTEYNSIIETESDVTGQTIRTQNTSIPIHTLSVIISTPLLGFLNTIDKHDVKELHFLDTGDVYTIKNIDIDDEGTRLNTEDLVLIRFEDEAISKVSDNVFVLDSQKQAFWDNNNNGSKDLDGEAQYDGLIDHVFNAWQLYYESDGVTPATSGDVLILAYATTQGGIESLIGVFQGEFLDLFSDSTKWQSTQQIWDYFNVADKVGHTNRVQFDKQAFAEDNGYLSDETEERAVSIRFDLSIDGSTVEPTTLALVYSLRGAFHSAGVQDPTTANYGYTTTGKVNRKNTLSTVIDTSINRPVATTINTITSFVLNNTTPFSNQYVLATAPAGEHTYQGSMTTPAGYIGSNYRGANGTNNFTFGINDAAAPSQALNILNFTTGFSPFLFNIRWKYDRVGAYPTLGDILAANAATILLDGVLVATPAIAKPSPVQVLGIQGVTLPDTQKHVLRFNCPTDGSFNIFTEFEVQIKPLF